MILEGKIMTLPCHLTFENLNTFFKPQENLTKNAQVTLTTEANPS